MLRRTKSELNGHIREWMCVETNQAVEEEVVVVGH